MAAAIHKNVKGNIKAHTALSICRAYSPTLAHPPALRLPGLLHYREGFTPLTVVTSRSRPIRRMLPWSTCGHTQDRVRIFIQPGSTKCNFMSQLTMKLSDARGPARPDWQLTW